MFWFILFVILLLVEIFTMALTTVWFAAGAFVAFLVALLGLDVWVQVVVFLVVSIGLLILTRPLAKKFFNSGREATNADRLVGQKAVVLEKIDTLHGVGRVEVNGMEWSAKTEEIQGEIEVGTIVLIEAIQGVKLIVKKEEA